MNAVTQPSGLALAVEDRLRQALPHNPFSDPVRDVVGDVSRHLCLATGARRFRPHLVERLGQLFDLPSHHLEAVACAAELIHAASLLHDDVVDAGTLRRGRPTANAVWGNSVAVLAGDWLLTRAFQQLEPLPVELTRSAIAMVGEMSGSALVEVAARNTVLPLDRWRSMAEGKTGALFAWCGTSVAFLAGRHDLAPAFDRFGRRLGLVFQLADDLRDFLDPRSGKALYADVRNGNPSAVIALAASIAPDLKAGLEAAWAGSDPIDENRWARKLMDTGAVGRALELLQFETEEALREVRGVDPSGTLRALFDSFHPGALA